MPYCINGIGTKWYGEREKGSDGSYITTTWVTFVWIPLFPIASYRIRAAPEMENDGSWFDVGDKYLAQRVPLNWVQVRNVYVAFVSLVAFTVGIFSILFFLISRYPG